MQEAPANPDQQIAEGLRMRNSLDAQGRLELRTQGLLKHDAAQAFQEYFAEQLTSHGTGTAVLDLTELSFLDSHGLALLLILHRLCQARGGKLILRGPNGNLRRLFELTRIDCLLTIE